MNLIEHKLLIDIIGYVSIIFSVLGFLSSKTNNMRLNGMISTLLFGISIYFYNGINGLFVCLISFCSKLLTLFIKEEKLIFMKYLSFPISIIFYFFFNNEGLIGLLPATSLIFIILGDIQKNILKMKLIYFGSIICWLSYAILLNSIPAILFDIFSLITLIYSILKLRKS